MGTKVKLNIKGLRAAVLTFMPLNSGHYQPLWKGYWFGYSNQVRILQAVEESETTGS